MLLKMLKTVKGKELNKDVQVYDLGETYDIICPDLTQVFLREKWAVELEPNPFIVGDIFAVPSEEAKKETYGLADHEIALLPVKKLAKIVKEEDLGISTENVAQAELAQEVIAAINKKYVGE